jgi:hypothetical protein
MEDILRKQNSRLSLAKFLPASLLGIYATTCQRALVGE